MDWLLIRLNSCFTRDRATTAFDTMKSLAERQLWGRLLNGRNFSGAGQSRHAAFGIAHRPRLWPEMGGLRHGGL